MEGIAAAQADWFVKHRQQRPAVAAVFFERWALHISFASQNTPGHPIHDPTLAACTALQRPRRLFEGFLLNVDPLVTKTRREAVVGDPNQWARVLAGLEAVRQATRPRGARMLLVIVSHLPAGPPTELPEDRIAALTRQAGIERRCVHVHTRSPQCPALSS